MSRIDAEDVFGLVLLLISIILATCLLMGCAVDKCSLTCQPKPLEVTIEIVLSDRDH